MSAVDSDEAGDTRYELMRDTTLVSSDSVESAMTVAGKSAVNRSIVLSYILAILVLVVDQLVKHWMLASLTVGTPVQVVGTLLRFNLHFNSGAAFSMGESFTWAFTIVSTLVAVALTYLIMNTPAPSWRFAFGLLLGGTLGNLGDRLFRAPSFAQGHVVDFIQLPHFAIFNVADMAITCAAGLMVFLAAFGQRSFGETSE